MRAFRLILIAAVLLVAVYARLASPPGGTATSGTAGSRVAQADVPAKAFDVLAYVRRTGEAPDGFVGGRVFQNREGRLPAEGNYREFDVDPHQGQRNAERLIVDWNTKKAWYTGDHYQTFVPLP